MRRHRQTGSKVHVVVVGTRGFPGIVGGVETHCEHLYSRIGAAGAVRITVVRRAAYLGPDEAERRYQGVEFIDLHVPVWPAFEAWFHTLLGILRARRLHADIVHIHSVGPALWAPLAKMLGMKVVATHHGADYARSRWGRIARFALRMGERIQVRFADEIIAVGPAIKEMLKQRYGRDSHLIFNGVLSPADVSREEFKRLWPDLEPGGYVLAAARHVPEKNLHLLVEAWRRWHPDGLQLVVAGDATPATAYSRRLHREAESAGVVLPGFVRDARLNALMRHARLFVLPSAHEGLPIALLEAMSHGRDVLCSDIAANRLAELDSADFFSLADDEARSVELLSEALRRKLAGESNGRTYSLEAYSWDLIAQRTAAIYQSLVP